MSNIFCWMTSILSFCATYSNQTESFRRTFWRRRLTPTHRSLFATCPDSMPSYLSKGTKNYLVCHRQCRMGTENFVLYACRMKFSIVLLSITSNPCNTGDIKNACSLRKKSGPMKSNGLPELVTHLTGSLASGPAMAAYLEWGPSKITMHVSNDRSAWTEHHWNVWGFRYAECMGTEMAVVSEIRRWMSLIDSQSIKDLKNVRKGHSGCAKLIQYSVDSFHHKWPAKESSPRQYRFGWFLAHWLRCEYDESVLLHKFLLLLPKSNITHNSAVCVMRYTKNKKSCDPGRLKGFGESRNRFSGQELIDFWIPTYIHSARPRRTVTLRGLNPLVYFMCRSLFPGGLQAE